MTIEEFKEITKGIDDLNWKSFCKMFDNPIMRIEFCSIKSIIKAYALTKCYYLLRSVFMDNDCVDLKDILEKESYEEKDIKTISYPLLEESTQILIKGIVEYGIEEAQKMIEELKDEKLNQLTGTFEDLERRFINVYNGITTKEK